MKKLLIILMFLFVLKPAETKVYNFALTEKNCLTANMYFEARGKGVTGMQTVADVTVNRVESENFPDTICAVVFQRKQFSWTHQIPKHKIYAILQGDVSALKPADKAAYKMAVKIAERTYKKGAILLPATVQFYHTPAVKPKWAKSMRKYAIIAGHVMYHTPPTRGKS